MLHHSSDALSERWKAFRITAIWGQCCPPRPRHKQMGDCQTCKWERDWWREQKNKKIDEITKDIRAWQEASERKGVGGRFYNRTGRSFSLHVQSDDEVCSQSAWMHSHTLGDAHTHFTPPWWRHLTALTHLRALCRARPITSLAAPGIPPLPR